MVVNLIVQLVVIDVAVQVAVGVEVAVAVQVAIGVQIVVPDTGVDGLRRDLAGVLGLALRLTLALSLTLALCLALKLSLTLKLALQLGLTLQLALRRIVVPMMIVPATHDTLLCVQETSPCRTKRLSSALRRSATNDVDRLRVLRFWISIADLLQRNPYV